MQNYKILVTGCPKSGTTYVSRMLLHAGVMAKHEQLSVDGIVSGLYCVEDFFYMVEGVPPASTCTFDIKLHLVRNPADCIPSIALNLPLRFWHWQEKHTGIEGDIKPDIERAALFWDVWNDIASRIPGIERVRLEDWDAQWTDLCHRLGVAVTEPLDIRPRATLHDRLKAEQLPMELLGVVNKRAREYGYEEIA